MNLSKIIMEIFKRDKIVVDASAVRLAREYMKDRRKDESLRNMNLPTGDFSFYTLENGEVFLGMADFENNLLFKNPGDFFPKDDDIDAVINAKSTTMYKISDLGLWGEGHKSSYYTIGTNDYDRLNPTQRALAETVFGREREFIDSMRMLREKLDNDLMEASRWERSGLGYADIKNVYHRKGNIDETMIILLHPDHVKKILANKDINKNNAKSLTLGSYLGSFEDCSAFSTIREYGYFRNWCLREVHCDAEGDRVPKIVECNNA